MRADRLGGGPRAPEFVFFGERQPPDRLEAADRLGRGEPRRGELLPVEPGMREEIGDLPPIERIVLRLLRLPGRGFDLRFEQAHRALPAPDSSPRPSAPT